MHSLTSLARACFSFCLLLGLLVAGCRTTPQVQSDAKPGQDFAAYRRFALLPLPEVKVASDPGLMLRITEPVQKTLVETLTAKGYQQVERAQADFSVSVRGQSLPRVEVTDWGYSPGVYARGRVVDPYHDVDVYAYDERTLTVEIYDERSKEQVWVGWMTGEGQGKVDPVKVCERLRLILAEFPPQAP